MADRPPDDPCGGWSFPAAHEKRSPLETALHDPALAPSELGALARGLRGTRWLRAASDIGIGRLLQRWI
jgi:hypothetical protein